MTETRELPGSPWARFAVTEEQGTVSACRKKVEGKKPFLKVSSDHTQAYIHGLTHTQITLRFLNILPMVCGCCFILSVGQPLSTSIDLCACLWRPASSL